MNDSRERGGLPRVPTEVPGLDDVLRGGLLAGGLYVVLGPPGTGKTILGNELCFGHARRGGRCVYVTLLAESHGRMLSHLQPMAFFEPAFVSQQVYYVSGYRVAKQQGLDALLAFLATLVQERSADLLVIDGLSTARAVAPNDLAFEEFLHALHVQIGLTSCTAVLLSNRTHGRDYPEYAMVDGVIALRLEEVGAHSLRHLEVQKFRGSKQLRGRHAFEISDRGITVYPRFEALYGAPPGRIVDVEERKSFDIPSLDEMLGGGLLGNSTTMLFGSPGIGKTLLGLSFLTAGAERGEPGLYFGFSETPERLVVKAKLLGLDLERHVREGRVVLQTRISSEVLPDQVAHDLVALIERHKVQRLVIDGIEPFVQGLAAEERTSPFISAFLNKLLDLGVSGIVTQQTAVLFGPAMDAPLTEVQAIIDNVIFVRFVELRSRLHRLITILKMRESENDTSLREFVIGDRGIEVIEPFSRVEAVLTGLPRPLTKEEQKDDVKPLRALVRKLKPAKTPKKSGLKRSPRGRS